MNRVPVNVLKQGEFNFKFAEKTGRLQTKVDIQKCWCDALLSITCILGVGTHDTCFDDSINAYHFNTQWNSGGWCMLLQYMKCSHSYCNINTWEINWHKFFIALPQPKPKEHIWESSNNSKYISNVCIKYWCHWALLHSSEMSHDQEQRWKWISICVNGLNVFKCT